MNANPEIGKSIIASIQSGFQQAFAAMFHGGEDQVIPLSNSLTLAQWISRLQLHVFGRCGYWTQIEHVARFNQKVANFLIWPQQS